MGTFLVCLGWLVGLAIALYASEKLVHFLTELGAEIIIPAGVLGLLVAAGADAPEVTSALIATARGSSDVGLGVILGSNIYNLAGLLGLSALLMRSIRTTSTRLVLDGGANVLFTLGLVGLILAPAWHLPLGIVLTCVLLGYVLYLALPLNRFIQMVPGVRRLTSLSPDGDDPALPTEPPRRLGTTMSLVALSVVFILIGSELLVNTSLTLGTRWGLSAGIIGALVLAVATSLPNTWAAVSLARRGFGSAAVATAFSSNSINAALGAGVPSLVAPLRIGGTERWVDAPWLVGMTALAIILLAGRRPIPRWGGALLIGGYVAFVVCAIVLFR